MDKQTYDSILSHYSKLYQKYGLHPSSLGWLKGKQEIRFKVATDIGDLQNSTILDVGCGFGDFATFLKKHKQKVRYTGVDVNGKFIEIASKINQDCAFHARDIEKKKFKKRFDWVFAIGLTNQSGSFRYIENLMKEMSRIARKGVAMDFLTTYVDYKKSGNFHASPERVFKISKKFSKRVVLRHDYLPFEFCVYIYKNDKIKKDLSFKDFKV